MPQPHVADQLAWKQQRHMMAVALRAELIRQAQECGAYIEIDQAGNVVAFDGTIHIEGLLDVIEFVQRNPS